MKTVNYKGYQASVEFDDGTLFVKVLHINDLLIAECDKASEVEATAAALIDDYLKTCAGLGKQPEQAFKGSFNVRMPPDLHKKVAMAATLEGITLNAWINAAAIAKIERTERTVHGDGLLAIPANKVFEATMSPDEIAASDRRAVALKENYLTFQKLGKTRSRAFQKAAKRSKKAS